MPAPDSETRSGPLLRRLPQVEKLLTSDDAGRLLASHARPELVRALRETLADLRQEILHAAGNGRPLDESCESRLEDLAARLEPRAVLAAASRRLAQRARAQYRRVVNATGIVLHTGLGRAVLPRAARDALTSALEGYTVVEVDTGSGERNRRETCVAELLCELTGAEAATVVNNNAGATLIVVAALARGREVIISRGELVEIGGSFRIPDVLREGGARLVEVGTTNRTYADDYRGALGAETGMLLSVHTSNYEITGFAHHTPLEELVALGREHGVPVVRDLGSGCLVDLSPLGFRREPLVAEAVATGADLVCFSGDKLLGGPQAGVIVGARDAVERVRRHPLFRALRVDKMTLVALEATLRLYRDPDRLGDALPALGMLARSEDEVRRRAEGLAASLASIGPAVATEVVRSSAQAGSGSLPAQDCPSWGVALAIGGLSADALAARLRGCEPPVFSRVQQDRVLLDCRTLLEGEDDLVRAAVERVSATHGASGRPSKG